MKNETAVEKKATWLREQLRDNESRLLGYVSRFAVAPETAREITQDAFLQLWREDTNALIGREAAWLFQVARDLALRAPKFEEDPETALERRERESDIERRLGELSREHQEILRLNLQDRFTAREIALITHATESTVEEKLREAFAFMASGTPSTIADVERELRRREPPRLTTMERSRILDEIAPVKHTPTPFSWADFFRSAARPFAIAVILGATLIGIVWIAIRSPDGESEKRDVRISGSAPRDMIGVVEPNSSAKRTLSAKTKVSPAPWNEKHRIVRVVIDGTTKPRTGRPNAGAKKIKLKIVFDPRHVRSHRLAGRGKPEPGKNEFIAAAENTVELIDEDETVDLYYEVVPMNEREAARLLGEELVRLSIED